MALQLKGRSALGAIALTLAFAGAWGAKAQADLKPVPIAPAIDGNGVDVVNWSYFYEIAQISLGPVNQNPVQVSILLPSERDSFSSNLRIQDTSGVTSGRSAASIGTKSWSFFGGGSSDPGAQLELFLDGGEYAYANVRARDGTIVSYEIPSWYAPGYGRPVNFCASRVEKPNGEVLTYYNEHLYPQCRTRSVVSNRGYQIRYEYPTVGWGAVRSKVTIINNAYEYCNPTAEICSLSYNWPSIQISSSSGNRTYTLHNGDTWQITSAGLTAPGQSVPEIRWTTETYYPVNEYLGSVDWRVTSATRDGKTWTYSYPSSDPVLGGVSGQLIRVQDPLGNVRRYRRNWADSGGDPHTVEYDRPNLMVKAIDENGNLATYSYDSQSMPLDMTLPEGNGHAVTYDNRNANVLTSTTKAKPGSALSDATTTYAYTMHPIASPPYTVSECCDRPATVTDPRGNVTEYTYDPVHKGILTETGPAPSSGAPRPVKRFAYVQRYAWVKNSSGSYVQAASPIWLLDNEKTCRTSATVGGACVAGTSDEVTTTFDYGPNSGPNNLWLRGKIVMADGVSLRTCYGYDQIGNKISETLPRADLTSCP